jgi:hypothetical protein
MTILSALTRLLHHSAFPPTPREAADRGGVSPPALAVAALVILLAVVIVATGAHEIIGDAVRDAWETLTG